jgi:hypothetical protein
MALSEPVILSCLMVLQSVVSGANAVTKSTFGWMGAGIWVSVVIIGRIDTIAWDNGPPGYVLHSSYPLQGSHRSLLLR